MSRILVRRGNKADLPTLNVGEPGFATDTKELFLGHSLGNLLIFTDVKSLAASGYQKLPGGLIIQWGRATPTSGVLTWVYPIAFPNKCVFVDGLIDGISGSDFATRSFNNISLGVSSAVLNQSNAGAASNQGATMFAIGY